MYRRVRVIDGWRRWRGLFDHDGWPQMWGQRPYKLIYEWEQGPIPAQWTIDHTCGEKDCLDHLEAVTRGENLRRRHARERGELPIGHAGMLPPNSAGSAKSDPPTAEPGTETEVAPLTSEERAAAIRRLRAEGLSLRKIADELGVSYATVWRSVEAGKSAAEGTPSTRAPANQFSIALFAGVSRPAVEQRIVSLDELRTMLNTFEVLKDKRRGRCWSPTQYADGATTRGNAGVELVSCLVFDCDRTAPDLERLGSVYWLGHTTHSHTPEAPRWRVVIPLVAPVPAAQWGDIWRRARAALCPEADPACKDPSRAYWLPSHNGGVSARATCHDGPLLDPATLPLLTEPVRPEFRRTSSSTVLRATTDADRRRGEAYMDKVIDNLAAMAPNTGRNVALNKAASTLGEWVAAGVLDLAQVEDALYAAAQANGLVAEDGQRQCWATIRSGLGHGLQHPYDLDADRG